MTSSRALPPTRLATVRISRWIPIFVLIYGAWVILPWVAPVVTHFGMPTVGKAIYFVYSFFCHQLPERSYFLFGRQFVYTLSEIRSGWRDTLNPMMLRTFIGNEGMGWKVAWSDRMVSFYTSIWLLALAWVPFRRRIKPLAWWGLALLLMPMILDGATHAVSDLSGLGRGFRELECLAADPDPQHPAWVLCW